MMPFGARLGFVLLSAPAWAFAIGLLLELPWATGVWPWAESRLTYIFIASVAGAVAAPIMWIGLSGEIAAARGGAINLIIIDGFFAAFFLWKGLYQDDLRFVAYGIGSGLATIAIIGIFIWSLRVPVRDREPVPFLVRLSFFVFAVVLLVTGVLLLVRVPGIFPWPLNEETSLLAGVIFVGAACYFAHAVVWPSRANATGQLLGFLVYDAVLIGPFLGRFPDVEPEYRLSLILYTVVIVYSGVLAAFYLASNLLTVAKPLREVAWWR
jgi:hypothetical protein